jgi:hypothetical protein
MLSPPRAARVGCPLFIRLASSLHIIPASAWRLNGEPKGPNGRAGNACRSAGSRASTGGFTGNRRSARGLTMSRSLQPARWPLPSQQLADSLRELLSAQPRATLDDFADEAQFFPSELPAAITTGRFGLGPAGHRYGYHTDLEPRSPAKKPRQGPRAGSTPR